MNRTVLVTGIGGVVGQGILRNISEFSPSIKIIGVNVVQVSAGNYMCDNVYKVPFAYDDRYITSMLEICTRENIDLIIPSTDYESYYLSHNRTLFNCPVASSPAAVAKMCLDKYTNWEGFSSFGIPFASSALPSAYSGQFERCIVKPREGRGSRNIYINPKNPAGFDDSYVVQEYLDGPELTTAFYVRKDGTLHGLITFVRELEQGNTAKAEVVFEYDKMVEAIILKMIRHYDFRGSCNIQCRVTANGVIPFEINCRISGTNSVRSQFGFHDVAYTLQEYLFNQDPDNPKITSGTALRVILDIIYPNVKQEDIANRNDRFYIH